jgi:hypothetical protein
MRYRYLSVCAEDIMSFSSSSYNRKISSSQIQVRFVIIKIKIYKSEKLKCSRSVCRYYIYFDNLNLASV